MNWSTGSGGHPDFRSRVGAVSAGVLALTLLSIGVARDDPGGPPAPPGMSVAAASPTPPGLQPDVQKWMKSRERMVIALNDSLVPVVRGQIAAGATGKAVCARVLAAVKPLLAQSQAPNSKIDVLARAGLPTIEQGAATCVAGDPSTGRQLMIKGLAERTDASLPLDEALEGE